MPVKQLVSDHPLLITLQQREDIRCIRVSTRQFARPMLNLQMHHRDRFDNFYSRKTRDNVWSWAVLVDPLENVLDRPAVVSSQTNPEIVASE